MEPAQELPGGGGLGGPGAEPVEPFVDGEMEGDDLALNFRAGRERAPEVDTRRAAERQ
jgi:hypothetical protein